MSHDIRKVARQVVGAVKTSSRIIAEADFRDDDDGTSFIFDERGLRVFGAIPRGTYLEFEPEEAKKLIKILEQILQTKEGV